MQALSEAKVLLIVILSQAKVLLVVTLSKAKDLLIVILNKAKDLAAGLSQPVRSFALLRMTMGGLGSKQGQVVSRHFPGEVIALSSTRLLAYPPTCQSQPSSLH